MKHPHVVTPEAPFWWEELCEYVGISLRLSKAFWCALCSSEDATIRALVFRCTEFASHIRKAGMGDTTRVINNFTHQTWHPQVLIHALERVHTKKLLDRRSCNKIEDAILGKADVNGNWQRHL
jgi:hypothetical protein